MDLNSWILAFHLLSAVALVGAMTVFSVMIAANWRTEDPAAVTSLAKLGAVSNVLVGVGAGGTIVFGVWLALSVDAYELWDSWVVFALVLWAIVMVLGKRTGDGYREVGELAARLESSGTPRSPELAAATGPSRQFWFHVASLVVVLLILIDMIWKPGA